MSVQHMIMSDNVKKSVYNNFERLKTLNDLFEEFNTRTWQHMSEDRLKEKEIKKAYDLYLENYQKVYSLLSETKKLLKHIKNSYDLPEAIKMRKLLYINDKNEKITEKLDKFEKTMYERVIQQPF